MATAIRATRSIRTDHPSHKEKENRRPERAAHIHQISSNSGSSGSVPKRYQSVFTEGTPIASFGVRQDDQQRSHSPSSHPQPQFPQRPLKPVKEFLSGQPVADQHVDDRRRSSSQVNGGNRAHTEATVQNVNAALSKTLQKLRPHPSNAAATNARSSPMYAESTANRPMTARSTLYQNTGTTTNTNFYYQLPNGMKGPLPAELITKRAASGVSQHRGPGGGPSATPIRHSSSSTDAEQVTISALSRSPTKGVETVVWQYEAPSSNNAAHDEYADKYQKSKADSNQQGAHRPLSRKQSPAPSVPGAERQQRSLPEVSVNPHIETPVQQNGHQMTHVEEQVQNGEMYPNRHHIRVEPTDTFKRVSSPAKHQSIVDVHPTVTVQHQRPSLTVNSRPQSVDNISAPATKDPLNEAYIERNNNGTPLKTIERTQANENPNDSTSTLKQYETQANGEKKSSDSTVTSPSQTTEEIDRIWKNPRDKHAVPSLQHAAAAASRQRTKEHRPPGRLKHYADESDSETTATESQNMAGRRALPPSDLGSDAWSDLTSEFSDTKLRKHPNIRTSTPNMTRHSSSVSSKEVGQIRKQLTDLQIMYNDLLKLLDIDLESVRSSVKSSTSSQVDHHARKHRFRKVVPVTSMRHSHIDMKEINQRFTRLESSVVTLAESIAKLSTQVQTQRTMKDDIHHLRQEVAELRQQVYHPRSTTPGAGRTSPMSSITQLPTRFVSPPAQRMPPVNNTSPMNGSLSYVPSSSATQRAHPILDPRQARKIEQFFGTEAMLRYFLSLLNYEEYAHLLEREKIGIYELPYVSERKLQSLGIPYGPCARIIYEAQQYFISLLTLKSSGLDV